MPTTAICEQDLDRVPAENLRVGRSEFAGLWAAAQAQQDSAACDAFTAGVLDTCRWLGRATIRPQAGPWFVAPSPVTGSSDEAMPERIAAEALNAETAWATSACTGPDRDRLAGIVATLRWSWSRTGPVPLRRDDDGMHQRHPGDDRTGAYSRSTSVALSPQRAS